jgi:hypothetical protein
MRSCETEKLLADLFKRVVLSVTDELRANGFTVLEATGLCPVTVGGGRCRLRD